MGIRGALDAYRATLLGVTRDLAAYGWTVVGILTLAAVWARWIAVGITHPEASAVVRAWTALRTMGADFTLLLVLAAASLASRLLPAPPARLRAGVFAATLFGGLLLLAIWFIDVEFFSAWGAPLNFELLTLAPHLSNYIFAVGVSNSAGALSAGVATAAALVLLAPPLVAFLAPRLSRDGRWRPAALAPAVLLGVAAAAASRASHADFREELVRRLNPYDLLKISREGALHVHEQAPAEERAAMAQVLGPRDTAASAGLQRLRGRKPNVILWVLESVGARYMRSLHPLGVAATPEMDRARERGGFAFTSAYAECPLTVQTTWALLTGQTPPAKPFGFVDGVLPPHSTGWAGELAGAGYRTGVFYASYTHIWGTSKVFATQKLDAFEDGEDLGKGGYAVNGIGVQDDALVDKLSAWLDEDRSGRPFAALLWNTETHKPYTWFGMPSEVAKRNDLARYAASIERSDALLGRLLDVLEQRKLRDDTLVIVVGDHGEGLGRFSRPWDMGHSIQVFEEEMHVPLVFLFPGLAGESRALVTHTDLLPTLMEIVGRPPVKGLDGRSLLEPLDPRPLYFRSIVWWPLAVHTGRYKLLLTQPGSRPTLYDLQSDPEESRDVGDEQPQIRSALLSDLMRWHNERFRSDPSFGYAFRPAQRIWGGRLGREEWSKAPLFSPEPKKPTTN